MVTPCTFDAYNVAGATPPILQKTTSWDHRKQEKTKTKITTTKINITCVLHLHLRLARACYCYAVGVILLYLFVCIFAFTRLPLLLASKSASNLTHIGERASGKFTVFSKQQQNPLFGGTRGVFRTNFTVYKHKRHKCSTQRSARPPILRAMVATYFEVLPLCVTRAIERPHLRWRFLLLQAVVFAAPRECSRVSCRAV